MTVVSPKIREIVLPALACLALVVGVLLTAQPAFAQNRDALGNAAVVERAFVEVIKKAEPATVSISRIRFSPTRRRELLDPFGLDRNHPGLPLNVSNPESPDFVPNDFGSGIVIAPNWKRGQRYVLTNYHVVRGGPPDGSSPTGGDVRLYVRFADQRGFYATILAADPRSDLAVLKVDSTTVGVKSRSLSAFSLDRNRPAEMQKGQLVLALGNPYAIGRDGSASASWGIIGNMNRRPAPIPLPLDEESLRKETIHHFGTLLQVDARLNLGTSGGPLVNLKGELIGITTSLAALDGYEKSAGFAIPIDTATLRVISSLVEGHEVEYGFLGVTPRDVLPEEMRSFSGDFTQATAAMAVSVFPRSPAGRAGLLPGDVVLSVIAGKREMPVLSRYDLMREIAQLGPEVITQLRVWRSRASEPLTLTVKLGKWPVYDDEGIIATNPRFPSWRGLSVDFPTGRRKFLHYPFRYYQAVVVKTVKEQSPADRAELQVGEFITHVNRQRVESPSQFQKAVENVSGEVTLRLIDGRQVVVPN